WCRSALVSECLNVAAAVPSRSARLITGRRVSGVACINVDSWFPSTWQQLSATDRAESSFEILYLVSNSLHPTHRVGLCLLNPEPNNGARLTGVSRAQGAGLKIR